MCYGVDLSRSLPLSLLLYFAFAAKKKRFLGGKVPKQREVNLHKRLLNTCFPKLKAYRSIQFGHVASSFNKYRYIIYLAVFSNLAVLIHKYMYM